MITCGLNVRHLGGFPSIASADPTSSALLKIKSIVMQTDPQSQRVVLYVQSARRMNWCFVLLPLYLSMSQHHV